MSENKIREEEVRHVALLSRLHCTDEEVESVTKELNSILENFAQLNTLNTDDVLPTSHSIKLVNVFREDKVKPSLSVEEALANAPESKENCFKVPKIIQES
jgi:aspartyl-tRNA(Asn)/glutamyl-tRNA(Gln) amidotransferase subunit C